MSRRPASGRHAPRVDRGHSRSPSAALVMVPGVSEGPMTRRLLNQSLADAKVAKEDEFYTQLADIERELKHYKRHFKGKVVYCNCDDPRVSNFFHYFSYNFEKLGLKKLIATCYKSQDVTCSARTTRNRRSTWSTTATRTTTTFPTPTRSGSSPSGRRRLPQRRRPSSCSSRPTSSSRWPPWDWFPPPEASPDALRQRSARVHDGPIVPCRRIRRRPLHVDRAELGGGERRL